MREILDQILIRAISTSSDSSSPIPAPIEYKCKRCRDQGLVVNADGLAERCECHQQDRLNRLFVSGRITPAFRLKTFNNFTVDNMPEGIKKMHACAFEYTKRFKEIRGTENNWMALLGEPGAGKTHLCMAVANNLISKGVTVLYFQHVDGMDELKDALNGNNRIRERLQQMQTVDVLYWDDLFKGNATDFEVNKVAFIVLNYRYLNLLPTIISSERTPDELFQIDKGVGRRILERATGHMVAVQGITNNYHLNLKRE